MIIVEVEPVEITQMWQGFLENCLFCGSKTKTWTLDKRSPVCVTCAEKHSPEDIPKSRKISV